MYVVRLITQRSQVQILPRYRGKRPHGAIAPAAVFRCDANQIVNHRADREALTEGYAEPDNGVYEFKGAD
jgi:hypothetical protein